MAARRHVLGGPREGRLVPLARRQLLHEPLELALALAGVTLAVALVGLLFGLREGIRHQVTTFVDNDGEDVYVAPRDSRSFITGGPPAVPASLAGELERQPGVEQAAPIVSSEAILRLRHQRVATQLVGFEPGQLGRSRASRCVSAVTPGLKTPSGRSDNRIAAMSVGGEEPRARGISATPLTLSGVLLLVGFVVNGIQRMIWHPSGAEDDHEAIFREYAASDAWEATHFAEFVLVLVALAGLLALCRAVRPEAPYLALLAAGALIVSGATWAALQAVDGVTLKQAVDAWVAASGTEEATRFADAETVRWIEWGLQSYFRVVLGVAFLLLGSAAVVSRLVPSWLGALLAVGGLLSLAIGFSVAYAGLESGFQDAVGIALQLVVLIFIVGLLVVGRRARGLGTRAAST